jgi:hypothetical protein
VQICIDFYRPTDKGSSRDALISGKQTDHGAHVVVGLRTFLAGNPS